NLSKALSGEQVYVERKFSSQKGKDLWLGIRYIPLTIKEQYVRFVLITARVITGEKDTAPSHENKPSQYSATINTMYDPLFVIDTNFRMEFCNESFIKWMSPLNLKINILNKNLFKVLPFFDAEMQKDYENVIETGEPSILKEQWMIRGISFFFEIVKIPVLENGITVRVITLIRDLTGIREIQRTMQNMLFRQITKKEYEILRCIARGFSRKEIAKEMNIACATYDKHLQNIKKKLNVFTRSGLIRIADSIIHD
ncbi:MAG TPA: PAS and helix-turn-helix domain-containing protein, partial [Spirochaetota bacterium]|nr:PAS and helix-turn-helix domain-containing protein [Spirochaetota bacterium]